MERSPLFIRGFLALILLSAILPFTAIAGIQPPLARPAYTPPPKPTDWELYEQVFSLQMAGKWRQADRILKKIDNDILMGHVFYQRYMHPTKYRASWKELRNWLHQYADHPNAWAVYKLAKSRKPYRARMPQKPPARIFHNQTVSSQSNLFQTRTARHIRNHVNSLIKRERPTQALQYISARSRKKRLSTAEFDYLQARISRSYYVEQKFEKALTIAQKAAARHRLHVPLSDWYAGLAAWRLGKFATAAPHFMALADHPTASNSLKATGAFWASRSLRQLDRLAEAENFLIKTTQLGVNFYSLLAMQQLSGQSYIEWVKVESADHMLIESHPAVQRSYALEYSGQHERAELELLYLQERLTDDEARIVLGLARHLNFPALEMTLGERLAKREKQVKTGAQENKLAPSYTLATALYPSLAPELHDFLLLDRALIYALIRQESRFMNHAKSRAGARGLMQLMPRTAAFISGDRRLARRSGRNQLLDREVNLELGQQYLALLLSDEYFNGNLIYALASYNAGPGNLRRWRKELADVNDPLLFIESIGITETRLYVKNVLRNLWIYRDQLHQDNNSQRILAAHSWPRYIAQDIAEDIQEKTASNQHTPKRQNIVSTVKR